MRSRLTLVGCVVPAVLLMLASGCPETVVTPPVPNNNNDNEPGEEPPPPIPLAVSLDSDRPQLIQGDLTQGGTGLRATASDQSNFTWGIGVGDLGDNITDAADFLFFALPDGRGACPSAPVGEAARNYVVPVFENVGPGLRSQICVTGVRRDPGLSGQTLHISVTASRVGPAAGESNPGDEDSDDVELRIVRPRGSLSVELSNVDGGTSIPVSDTGFIQLKATIIGGEPFAAAPPDLATNRAGCRQADNSAPCVECNFSDAGEDGLAPYRVEWRRSGSANDPDLCFEAERLSSNVNTGEIIATAKMQRPTSPGSLAFEVMVSDRSGNRDTDSLPLQVTATQPLSIGEAGPDEARVSPGGSVGISASALGGTGPYTIVFELGRGDEEFGELGVSGNATSTGRTTSLTCCNTNCDVNPDCADCDLAPKANGDCEVFFIAKEENGSPTIAGSVLIKVTIEDSDEASQTTTFPLSVEPDAPLAVSAFFSAPFVASLQPASFSGTISGGTPPYYACVFRLGNTAAIDPRLSSTKTQSPCTPAISLPTVPPGAICTCEMPTGGASQVAFGHIVYTAGTATGVDQVRVVVGDSARTTAEDTQGIGFGSGGGQTNPTGCAGGNVALSPAAADPSPCLGSSTPINVAITSGLGPNFTVNFAIQGALAAGEGLGSPGSGTDSKAATCSNLSVSTTYFAPSTALGPRTIIITATDGASNAPAQNVSINPVGLPSASIAALPPVCLDDPDPTLAGTVTGGTPAYNITWSLVDDLNAPVANAIVQTPANSDPTPTLDFSALAVPGPSSRVFVATMTVTDAQGCSPSPAPAPIAITVHPNPPTAVAGVTPSGTVCEGTTVTFTGSPPGLASYDWTGPGGFSTTSTTTPNSNRSNVIPGHSGTYTFTLTDANGCDDSATVNLAVQPMPTLSAGGPYVVCEQFVGSSPPTSVALNGVTGTSINPATCLWTGGAGTFTNATGLITDFIYTPALSESGIITLTLDCDPVPSSNLCVLPPVNTTVNVAAKPSASFSFNQTQYCPGGTDVVTATSAVAGVQHEWMVLTGNASPSFISGLNIFNFVPTAGASAVDVKLKVKQTSGLLCSNEFTASIASNNSGCGDGNTCTNDFCDPITGSCANIFDPTTGDCFIGGACFPSGSLNPGNGCEICNNATPTVWTLRSPGSDCDNGNPCIDHGTCSGGICSSIAPVCTAGICADTDGSTIRSGMYSCTGGCVNNPDCVDPTTPQCDKPTGLCQCAASGPNDSCADDDPDRCNGIETCISGACITTLGSAVCTNHGCLHSGAPGSGLYTCATGCISNGDCSLLPSTPSCNVGTGDCECTSSTSCSANTPATPICVSGICQNCTLDAECSAVTPEEPICTGGMCGCTTSATCSLNTPATPICTGGVCVPCAPGAPGDAECAAVTPEEPICTAGMCGCTSSTSCSANTPATPICVSGLCQPCTVNSQCFAATPEEPVCNSGSGACECTSSATCAFFTPTTPVCNPTTRVCE